MNSQHKTPPTPTSELQSITYLKYKVEFPASPFQVSQLELPGTFSPVHHYPETHVLVPGMKRLPQNPSLSLTCLSFKAAWTEGLFSICWASLLFLALASCCCCCMVARIFTGIGCLFFSMLVKLQGRIKWVFKESFYYIHLLAFHGSQDWISRSHEPYVKSGTQVTAYGIRYSLFSTNVQELETQK